jgi:hypothetical protein
MRRVLVLATVVLLAVALFLWRRRGPAPVFEAPNDVRVCADNLRALYAGLREYHARFGRLPEGRGPAFLAALVAEGLWSDTPAERARLTCPGPGAAPVPEGVDYRRPAGLGGVDSAYAVRDFAAFPLARFPAGGHALEPLVACDNQRAMNHDACTNVLYTDGSVRTLTLAQEVERGHLPPGARVMAVGPEATIPDLAKLLPD